MSRLTVKRLLIYTACLFFLNGCSGGSGDGSSSSEVSLGPRGNGTALISWTAPTENTDNTTLTDLAGFKIYYGTFPGEYGNTIMVANAGLSSYLVEGLGAADWFFVMTAFNSSNIESAYSKEVFKTVN